MLGPESSSDQLTMTFRGGYPHKNRFLAMFMALSELLALSSGFVQSVVVRCPISTGSRILYCGQASRIACHPVREHVIGERPTSEGPAVVLLILMSYAIAP